MLRMTAMMMAVQMAMRAVTKVDKAAVKDKAAKILASMVAMVMKTPALQGRVRAAQMPTAKAAGRSMEPAMGQAAPVRHGRKKVFQRSNLAA